MPIAYPTNPTTNQTYTYLGVTWAYNGKRWIKAGSSGIAVVGYTGSFGYTGSIGYTGSASLGYTGSIGSAGLTAITTINDQQNTGTGALGLPVGTTAQRPASPVNGYMRFNTTIGYGEYYNATTTQWLTFGTPPEISLEYIVVAGGGGGGRGEGNPTGDGAGGGGAGGFRTGTMLLPSSVQYNITVGGYGAGSSNPAARGSNGTDSTFNNITATGGGGGGSDSSDTNANGAAGGSGGGAASSYPTFTYTGGISSPVTNPVQGYKGGDGAGNRNGCGGGGSAARSCRRRRPALCGTRASRARWGLPTQPSAARGWARCM